MILNPFPWVVSSHLCGVRERERGKEAFFASVNDDRLPSVKPLEMGCGSSNNLLS